jgi:drug/metabolite transporter (DMT)-like permease
MSLLVPAILSLRGKEADELSTSIDVAISFLIVAVVIGLGFIKTFTPLEGKAWSLAVVLNVLGAGLFQVNQAYAKLQ